MGCGNSKPTIDSPVSTRKRNIITSRFKTTPDEINLYPWLVSSATLYRFQFFCRVTFLDCICWKRQCLAKIDTNNVWMSSSMRKKEVQRSCHSQWCWNLAKIWLENELWVLDAAARPRIEQSSPINLNNFTILNHHFSNTSSWNVSLANPRRHPRIDLPAPHQHLQQTHHSNPPTV